MRSRTTFMTPKLLLILLACSPCLFASGSETSSKPIELRVITYNAQFLPPPVAGQNERGEPAYRARRIAEKVGAYDIAALQEVFHRGHRKRLTRTLRETWDGDLNMVRSPSAGNHFTHGGCLILTRLPITQSNACVFEHYSRSRDYGLRADGWAAKGVIHARIHADHDQPGRFIDVYATHLEARADYLRPKQYEEMARFMAGTASPHAPFLLMGDLNTQGGPEAREDPDSQYNALWRSLRNALPEVDFVDVWPALHPKALGGTTKQESSDIGKRIDYIIAGNPVNAGSRLVPERIEVKLFRDARVEALSDHNGVMVVFEWEH